MVSKKKENKVEIQLKFNIGSQLYTERTILISIPITDSGYLAFYSESLIKRSF